MRFAIYHLNRHGHYLHQHLPCLLLPNLFSLIYSIPQYWRQSAYTPTCPCISVIVSIFNCFQRFNVDSDKLQGVIRNPFAFYFPIQRGFIGSIQTLANDSTHCKPYDEAKMIQWARALTL